MNSSIGDVRFLQKEAFRMIKNIQLYKNYDEWKIKQYESCLNQLIDRIEVKRQMEQMFSLRQEAKSFNKDDSDDCFDFCANAIINWLRSKDPSRHEQQSPLVQSLPNQSSQQSKHQSLSSSIGIYNPIVPALVQSQPISSSNGISTNSVGMQSFNIVPSSKQQSHSMNHLVSSNNGFGQVQNYGYQQSYQQQQQQQVQQVQQVHQVQKQVPMNSIGTQQTVMRQQTNPQDLISSKREAVQGQLQPQSTRPVQEQSASRIYPTNSLLDSIVKPYDVSPNAQHQLSSSVSAFSNLESSLSNLTTQQVQNKVQKDQPQVQVQDTGDKSTYASISNVSTKSTTPTNSVNASSLYYDPKNTSFVLDKPIPGSACTIPESTSKSTLEKETIVSTNQESNKLPGITLTPTVTVTVNESLEETSTKSPKSTSRVEHVQTDYETPSIPSSYYNNNGNSHYYYNNGSNSVQDQSSSFTQHWNDIYPRDTSSGSSHYQHYTMTNHQDDHQDSDQEDYSKDLNNIPSDIYVEN